MTPQTPPSKHTYWLPFWLGGFIGSILMVAILFAQPTNSQLNTVRVRQFARIVQPELWHADLPLTVTHLETPVAVRGIYLSSWTTGTTSSRARLISFIKKNPALNSVIIDIKDSTGILSYTGNDDTIRSLGTYSKRVRDIEKVIQEFHKHNIYVIGRVTAFEDPYLGTKKDAFVLANKEGLAWRSTKGKRQWIDPANVEYRDYLVRVSREAYSLGVDEINFDYVRYPSEGDTQNILLPDNVTKHMVMKDFFGYIDSELRQKSKIPISADVFGLTTTETTDMGIGQIWEDIIPHVDFISPMIYPSHYAPGSFGYANPAEFPGEVVARAIKGALEKNKAIGQPNSKIRPWVQDFDLGAVYDKEAVQAQISSMADLGINSYLSWDPSNRYTENAYID